MNKVGIFGSYARGERTETSDVDVLIDYEEAPTCQEIPKLSRY
ncbi:nucleotidyltransferase family protein [Leptolyngbya sp. GGD]|nr:nucleotidyltransferase domain-containing protein [Leptolyngbya sp. GGD]MCY6491573.1 nucleotidyltransferase domain-containing protein [Leptolyngbya sp. GGD]